MREDRRTINVDRSSDTTEKIGMILSLMSPIGRNRKLSGVNIGMNKTKCVHAIPTESLSLVRDSRKGNVPVRQFLTSQ